MSLVGGRLNVLGTRPVSDTWQWTAAGGWVDLDAKLPSIALGQMGVGFDGEFPVLYTDSLTFGAGDSHLYRFENDQWVIKQSRPTDRGFTAASWSSANQQMLLEGGLEIEANGAPSGQPKHGTFLVAADRPFVTMPEPYRVGARRGVASATLADGSVLMFGGSNDETRLNQTLVWNGGAWSLVAAGPNARRSAALAPLGAKAVLFGGNDG